MPDVYQVEPVSFGYHVRWGERELAVVIIEDEDVRMYRCCRCKASACDHARAVLRFVIDRESV